MKRVLFRIFRHRVIPLLTSKSLYLELDPYSQLYSDSNRLVGMLGIRMGFSDRQAS